MPDEDQEVPLVELFESLQSDNGWDEAELPDVVRYLRKSRFVKIPLEFKNLIPKDDL